MPYAPRAGARRAPGSRRSCSSQTVAGPLAGDRTDRRGRGRRGGRRSRSSATPRRSPSRPRRRRASTCALGSAAGARLALAPRAADPRARLQPRVVAPARARRRRGGAHARARRARPPRRAAGPLPLRAALRARGPAAAARGGRDRRGGTSRRRSSADARAFGSLALLGLRAGACGLELDGPGRVWRVLAPDAATLAARSRGDRGAQRIPRCSCNGGLRGSRLLERSSSHPTRSSASSRRSGPVVSACSGPSSATARSSTTTSSRRPTCRSAGRTARTPARYRLERRSDEARFGYAVGPHSWKRYLFPPRIRLWRARANGGAPAIEEEPLDETPLAFIGVRSLRAARDRDPGPRLHRRPRRRPRLRGAPRRARSSSRSTASSPPRPASAPRWARGRGVTAGYDLALTELLDGEHRFLVEAGSERGAEVLAELPLAAGRRRRPRRPPTRRVEAAAAKMGRTHGGLGPPRPACQQSRAPALGRRREALPDLRQLHARLPDLLLLGGRGRRPISRARTSSAGASGTRASRSTTRTSTAAASGPRGARATGSG